ncbi:MAG: D-alanyl-D-alanine carboxypeptidase [Lachnospiraceae bacterium]|nr:D-alanyl-D-alanine carboxypeptidase [Lachnospiraceae bacterium]
MEKTVLKKGEYLDSRGNVRQHSEKYYARRRQIRTRLTIFFSVVFVLLAGAGILLGLHIHSKAAAAAAPEELSADRTEQETPELMAEGEHSTQAVMLPAVDVAEPEEVAVVKDPEELAVVNPEEAGEESASDVPEGVIKGDPKLFYEGYTAFADDDTQKINDTDVISEYAVLIDLKDGHIVAQKNAGEKIYPASMTKVLSLLVAVEHISDYQATATITQEIADYVWKHDCAAVGYLVGEKPTVEELLYGTILPSGGDAVLALADHTAGSMEAFVDLMNEKVAELGLADVAHFANPIGIHDEQNYCTPIAMAMIMKAALENPKCREVLATKRYTTAKTEEHPEGLQISNLFLRRIEDKDTHGEVLGAKTGFVTQSRNCAVSYERSNDGNEYICVTVGAHSAWRAIYDHVAIYDTFVK